MKTSAILFAGLWLADTVLTSILVASAGVDAEANPIMRSVFEHGGIATFVVIKLALLLFLLSLESRISWKIFAGLSLIMTPVVTLGFFLLPVTM